MESTKKFSEFGQIVEELQKLSQKLMLAIEKQTRAVIASNHQKIEQYAELYTSLQCSFKEQENKFIDQLRAMLSSEGNNKGHLKLEQLKEPYPQYTEIIDQWEESLGKQTRQLKRKHQKLNELLEFALSRNVELMHSIYSHHNKKNTHYGSGGSKEEMAPGIAVNKEA